MCLSGVCDRAGCACLVCATGLGVLVWCVRQGWMYLSGVTGLDVLVWCVRQG